ncbi:MAG TPA: ribosome biogenesis GTP-binding protein YihA/YsxC [Blastocatellia bacterium]|nr:ribosome biogenesis GTP-binding protein YihA/YsxC [Blastocatellia bacterium]
MKIFNTRFVKSAVEPEHFPATGLPEIAFLGRSNVGKSSLINSLLGVRGLARTSSTPGRTQLINFFEINGSFYFVDLPGYGYARAPLEIKRKWGPMVETYLASRSTLVLCIVITDLRHEPTQLDLQMTNWLQSKRIPYRVIATKADKLSSNQSRARLASASAVFGDQDVIPYSALTRLGADRIWKEITVRLPGNQRSR